MSVNDKDSTKHQDENTLRSSPTSISGEVDDAWKYLDAHRDVNVGNEPIDMVAIRRKIDYRVVPLGFLLYMMQFADKLVVNVSPLSAGASQRQMARHSADLYDFTVRRRHDNARGP